MRSVLLVLATASLVPADPPVYRVSKDGGTHAVLQAAVDACPGSGCRIELPDSLYELSEPVSIRGKADVEILGARPDGSRPILRVASDARGEQPIPDLAGHSGANLRPVRYSKASRPDTLVDPDRTRTIRTLAVDTGDAGRVAGILLAQGRLPDGTLDPQRPRGWMLSPYDLASTRDSNLPERLRGSGHQFAALVLVDSSRRISVSGLEFSGEAPLEFVARAVWNGTEDARSGLAAIAIAGSLDGRVENCLFHGWSVAVRLHEANRGGLVTDILARRAGVTGAASYAPLSAAGTTGGHAIEGNLAHGNHYAMTVSSSMDLGTAIRFNRLWENGLTRMLAGARLAFQSGPNAWLGGGAVWFDGETCVPHVVQGNTLVRNTAGLFWKGSPSQTAHFLDNVEVRRDAWNSWIESAEAIGWDTTNPLMRTNWFASTAASRYDNTLWRRAVDSVVPFSPATRSEPFTPAWGSPAIDACLIGKGWFGDDLGAVWRETRPPEAIVLHDQGLAHVQRIAKGWNVVLALPLEMSRSIREPRLFLPLAQPLEKAGGKPPTPGSSLVSIASLDGLPVQSGISLLQFQLPAEADDLLWRLEMAVVGTDAKTGRNVHSNLGTWLLRPMARRIVVEYSDSSIQPGEVVDFTVTARDSSGKSLALEHAPVLHGEGWSILETFRTRVSARAAEPAGDAFVVRAKAPEQEGISRLTIAGSGDPGLQAAPGMNFMQIGGTTGDPSSQALPSRARIVRIHRDAAGWTLDVAGLDPVGLDGYGIVDAHGRHVTPAWSTASRIPSFRLPRAARGTWFLRGGGTTLPFVLVP